MKRLEALVQEMESGELPLEDILKKYEEGTHLIKLCAAKLNEAEQRIEVLMKEKDGSFGLKAFDLEEVDEEENGSKEEEQPSNRRSKTTEEKDLF